MRRWLRRVAVAAVLLAVIGAGTGYWAYRTVMAVGAQPLAVAPDAANLVVERGESFAAIAARLAERGVVGDERWLRLYGRLTGRASRVQAGEYRLARGMDVDELLGAMERGDVVRYRLTIVEGWTFREMIDALGEHEALVHTIQDLPEAAVMERIGAGGTHPEGRFLPETYHFTRGTRDVALLRRAYEAMERTLAQAWEGRADGLPLESPYEALILASIIEKETAVPSERRRIAGVFVRRLKRGMRLQTDPTVIYGLGEAYDGDIRYRDLRRDTPYNTYTRHGLPPTPIALPGALAIDAAVNPADGDSLYFVAKDDGTHHFSATLAEHNRAVRRYQME